LAVRGLKRRQGERRISAFNFFVKEMVAQVRVDSPDLEHQECMKRVLDMYMCRAYCIWSVVSPISKLNQSPSSLRLFCYILLKWDQLDWDWRWIRCIRQVLYMNVYIYTALMYVYTRYMNVCIYTHICGYVYVQICSYVCECVCAYLCISIYMCGWSRLI